MWNLWQQLYLVVAHNLNKARKARDKNKPMKNTVKNWKCDNVLVRDHTPKVFQPKYTDFCIVGFMGKNQVEINDNHGHTIKLHCKDIKKIPMPKKISQIYKKE